ncbi:cation diffusion facilitator family transporter [Alphaproteobacteria bacterium]|nr:cation diffusion facilitator family transporter [Alphaproteobacteria bacterium]
MTQTHNHTDDHEPALFAPDPMGVEPGNRVRWTALLAILVASVLIIIKAGAWFLTGSVALLGSFLDSVMDLSLSVMNFFAIRHAQTPADAEHRFGHGKAEALAALVQGAVLLAAAIYLIYEVVLAIMNPPVIAYSYVGIGVMVASIVLTLGLVMVQRSVAKSTKSVAITADMAHYTGDIFINLGVILALVLSGILGMPYADPILGTIVALILANSARNIFIKASDQLMDREFEDDEREDIKQIILSHPQVLGVHDLRTRRAGLTSFIQCHIELDGSISLNMAHKISDAVEASVLAKFPQAEVLLHQDPEGEENLSPLEQS